MGTGNILLGGSPEMDYNLGQNKMEQQTPIPPKSRMKLHEGQKRGILPSLIWGRGGGSRFSIYFVQDCSIPSRGGGWVAILLHCTHASC